MPKVQVSRPTFLVVAMLIVIALTTWIRVAFLFTSELDLFFDEAQYWYWSQFLDWGYYSKPPMVAWIIKLTTSFCGQTEGCVRLGSPLLHAATSLCIFAAGWRLFGPTVGAVSAITYITLPAVTVSSALISTDPPLLFFSSLGLLMLICALQTNRWVWWISLGIVVGLGGLSKYTMVLFGVSTFLVMVTHPPYREYLKQPKCYVAGLIALLVIFPNVWWNIQHDFVSFGHTRDNANIETVNINIWHMLEFIGAQFGVFGPILFASLIAIILRFKAIMKDNRQVMLLWFILPLLAIITSISLLSRAHANWAAPIYVGAVILVIAWLWEKGRTGLIVCSIVLHNIAFIIAGNIETLASFGGWSLANKTNIESKQIQDPFVRLRDWDTLASYVHVIRSQYPNTTLMTDSRKLYSELVYYLSPRPFDMVKFNANGRVDDHFEMVTEAQVKKDYIFITDRESSIDRYFKMVELLTIIELPRQVHRKNRYFIYYATSFKGY